MLIYINKANFILAVEGGWGVGVLRGLQVLNVVCLWFKIEGEVKTKVFLKSLSRQHLSFKKNYKRIIIL